MVSSPLHVHASPPPLKLKREHVLGVRTDLPSCNIHYIDSNRIIYACDNLLVIANLETQEQSFIETTKSTNNIAAFNVSSDGTLLALAENENANDETSNTVCAPSLVTIYDLNTFKKKKVIRLSHEHATGNILHIGFIDSTHILVLGGAPTYNLTLWSVDRGSTLPTCTSTTSYSPAKASKHPGGVVASVKLATPSGKAVYCADAGPITDEAGNVIVCATGNGVVRFFRLTNNTFRPITVNLKRKQQNYVVHKWLSSGNIALGTDTGEVIIIENFSARAVIHLPEPCQRVTSLADYSGGGLVVGSNGGMVHLFDAVQDEDLCYQRAASLGLEVAEEHSSTTTVTSIAVSPAGDEAVWATSQMFKLPLSSSDVFDKGCMVLDRAIPPFHPFAEQGCHSIDVCLWRPLVATSGPDNTVRIWNCRSRKLEAMKRFDTAILNICFHPSSFRLIVCTEGKIFACDIVRDMSNGTKETSSHTSNTPVTKGSSSRPAIVQCTAKSLPCTICISGKIEMKSPSQCRFSNGGSYFAVSSGSALHVYDAYSLKEACALRGHSSDIKSIQWQDGDQRLCSIGADGVLCIWTVPNGNKIRRHVNALSSHRSGALNDKFTRAIVSTETSVSIVDIQVQDKASVEVPFCESSWNMVQISGCGQVLVGADANDPRLLYAAFLGLEADSTNSFAQTVPGMQQITSLFLSGSRLFATSNNGSMHLFRIVHSALSDTSSNKGGGKASAILTDEVLLSGLDLAERNALIHSLEQQLANVQQSNAQDIQRLEDVHRNELDEIQKQHKVDLEKNQHRCKEAVEKKRQLQLRHNKSVSVAQEAHNAELREIEEKSKRKISAETDRIAQLEAECESKARKWQQELKDRDEESAAEIQRLTDDYNQRTKQEVALQSELTRKQEDMLSRHKKLQKSLELEADDEVTAIMLSAEKELVGERKATRNLQEEKSILEKKFEALVADLDEQKETIESLEEKETDLTSTIDELKVAIAGKQADMKTKDDDLVRKEQDAVDLQSQCDTLEQQKAILSDQVADLKKSFVPIEEDILGKGKKAAQSEADLAASKQAHASAELYIRNLKDKAAGLDKEMKLQKQRIQDKASYTAQLEADIKSLAAAAKESACDVKSKLVPLYRKYLRDSCGSGGCGDMSIADETCASALETRSGRSTKESGSRETELARRERHLKKKIDTTKAALEKNERRHRKDMAKLKWQQQVLRKDVDDLTSKRAPVQVQHVEEKENHRRGPVDDKENQPS